MKHDNDDSKTKHATQNLNHQKAVALRTQQLENHPEKEGILKFCAKSERYAKEVPVSDCQKPAPDIDFGLVFRGNLEFWVQLF